MLPSKLSTYDFSFSIILVFVFSRYREQVEEVQEEYREREKRWNRIASLLDREDLISNCSTSTTSTSLSGTQYTPPVSSSGLINTIPAGNLSLFVW